MSVPALVSAQEIMLKWGFVEGSEQVLQLTNRMEISMPIGFASQVMDQSIRMRQTVQSVESNGDATVTVTTEHIRMEGVGPGGDQLYDSVGLGQMSRGLAPARIVRLMFPCVLQHSCSECPRG